MTKTTFDTAGLTEFASAASKKNLEAYSSSVSTAQANAQKLTARAVAFTQATVQKHAEATQSLLASKSPQEFFEKQAAYTKSLFETYFTEVKAVQDVLAGAAQDMIKPPSI